MINAHMASVPRRNKNKRQCLFDDDLLTIRIIRFSLGDRAWLDRVAGVSSPQFRRFGGSSAEAFCPPLLNARIRARFPHRAAEADELALARGVEVPQLEDFSDSVMETGADSHLTGYEARSPPESNPNEESVP
jgi:hypothetical protein